MRFWLTIAVLLALDGSAAAQSEPGPVGSPEGPWRAQIHWVPVDISGARYLLQTRICRPPVETPARVAVIAHGAVDDRSALALPGCDQEWARWFLDRGYVVAFGLRRGFGATGGYYAEGGPGCGGDPDYVRIGLETARDIAAFVDYAGTLPFARPQGIVVIGASAGGWGVIAHNSLPHPRVTGFVNMAGGRGGHWEGRVNNNCRPELLIEAAGRFARTATTPMLWVYAENDSYFAPAIAEAMYGAYVQNGGRAEFRRVRAFGQDGHLLFFARGGSQIWGPLVERYLASRPAL